MNAPNVKCADYGGFLGAYTCYPQDTCQQSRAVEGIQQGQGEYNVCMDGICSCVCGHHEAKSPADTSVKAMSPVVMESTEAEQYKYMDQQYDGPQLQDKQHTPPSFYDQKEADKQNCSQLYGEIFYPGVRALQDWRHLVGKSTQYAMDLGMGCGRAIFQSFLEYPQIQKCTGAEQAQSRVCTAYDAQCALGRHRGYPVLAKLLNQGKGVGYSFSQAKTRAQTRTMDQQHAHQSGIRQWLWWSVGQGAKLKDSQMQNKSLFVAGSVPAQQLGCSCCDYQFQQGKWIRIPSCSVLDGQSKVLTNEEVEILVQDLCSISTATQSSHLDDVQDMYPHKPNVALQMLKKTQQPVLPSQCRVCNTPNHSYFRLNATTTHASPLPYACSEVLGDISHHTECVCQCNCKFCHTTKITNDNASHGSYSQYGREQEYKKSRTHVDLSTSHAEYIKIVTMGLQYGYVPSDVVHVTELESLESATLYSPCSSHFWSHAGYEGMELVHKRGYKDHVELMTDANEEKDIVLPKGNGGLQSLRIDQVVDMPSSNNNNSNHVRKHFTSMEDIRIFAIEDLTRHNRCSWSSKHDKSSDPGLQKQCFHGIRSEAYNAVARLFRETATKSILCTVNNTISTEQGNLAIYKQCLGSRNPSSYGDSSLLLDRAMEKQQGLKGHIPGVSVTQDAGQTLVNTSETQWTVENVQFATEQVTEVSGKSLGPQAPQLLGCNQYTGIIGKDGVLPTLPCWCSTTPYTLRDDTSICLSSVSSITRGKLHLRGKVQTPCSNKARMLEVRHQNIFDTADVIHADLVIMEVKLRQPMFPMVRKQLSRLKPATRILAYEDQGDVYHGCGCIETREKANCSDRQVHRDQYIQQLSIMQRVQSGRQHFTPYRLYKAFTEQATGWGCSERQEWLLLPQCKIEARVYDNNNTNASYSHDIYTTLLKSQGSMQYTVTQSLPSQVWSYMSGNMQASTSRIQKQGSIVQTLHLTLENAFEPKSNSYVVISPYNLEYYSNADILHRQIQQNDAFQIQALSTQSTIPNIITSLSFTIQDIITRCQSHNLYSVTPLILQFQPSPDGVSSLTTQLGTTTGTFYTVQRMEVHLTSLQETQLQPNICANGCIQTLPLPAPLYRQPGNTQADRVPTSWAVHVGHRFHQYIVY